VLQLNETLLQRSLKPMALEDDWFAAESDDSDEEERAAEKHARSCWRTGKP
jgi:hypothetical protein